MPIYLRDVALVLQRHLVRDEASDYCGLHWISVEGEDSLKRPNKTVADDFFERQRIIAALGPGHSEGSLIGLYAQADRYDRAAVTPLFLIKTLNGLRKAALEVADVVEFFETQDILQLVTSAETSAQLPSVRSEI